MILESDDCFVFLMYGRKGWFNWCHCRYVYCRAKLKGHVYILGGDKWSYSYHLVLCNLFFLMLDSWSWSYVDGKYCKFFFLNATSVLGKAE